MADEITTPEQVQQKQQKPKKVTVILTRAASVNIDGVVMRKGDTLELENSRADRFLNTGLFDRK